MSYTGVCSEKSKYFTQTSGEKGPMPLPVVAAVRRELERKTLVRDKGICLTPEGLELVSELYTKK